MSRHPIDILKAALQEAKTEAATLRIARDLLVKERNVVIEERNKARARVKELEQQNAVQRENVDEAMRRSTRLGERVLELELFIADTGVTSAQEDAAKRLRDLRTENTRLRSLVSTAAGPDTLARIRELEAEVQRLQRDRAQVGAFGFKPLGIR